MIKIEAIIKPDKLDEVKEALGALGASGLTITAETRGCGRQMHYGTEADISFIPKVKIEVVVSDDVAEKVITAIQNQAETDTIDGGKIFISKLEEVVSIRTGERGETAI